MACLLSVHRWKRVRFTSVDESQWCSSVDSLRRLRLVFQPISRSRSFTNWSSGNGLVNMSAICSFVEICPMFIVFPMWERKWCRRTDRCLVLGLLLWLVAISMQLLLSSKVLHRTVGRDGCNLKPFRLSSFMRFITAITSLNALDSAMYSASVVLSAIKDCIELFQIMGHPAYIMTYPVLESKNNINTPFPLHLKFEMDIWALLPTMLMASPFWTLEKYCVHVKAKHNKWGF